MTIKSAWRQDVSLDLHDLGALDHGAFLTTMQDFDWTGAGERERALAAEGEECCPAGFGAERSDGSSLHLHSSDGQRFSGSVTLVKAKKVFGFIPSQSRDMTQLQGVSGDTTRALIQVFFTADSAGLEAHLASLG